MTADLRALLDQHHVLVPADNPFQRRARLLQALWREDRGLPIGEHRGRPLGSRLAMPEVRERLTNYLTVLTGAASGGALLRRPISTRNAGPADAVGHLGSSDVGPPLPQPETTAAPAEPSAASTTTPP